MDPKKFRENLENGKQSVQRADTERSTPEPGDDIIPYPNTSRDDIIPYPNTSRADIIPYPNTSRADSYQRLPDPGEGD